MSEKINKFLQDDADKLESLGRNRFGLEENMVLQSTANGKETEYV